MKATPELTIPPQNFAVSCVPREDRETQRQRQIKLLSERRDASWRRWWRLYSEPDVWTNLEKRHEMLVARGDYHDSFAEWSLARTGRI